MKRRERAGVRAGRLLPPIPVVLFLLLLTLLLGGCGTTTKMAPGFGDIEKQMEVITVMPPAFSLQKVGAFAAEPVAAMTHDIELELKGSLEQLVENHPRYRVAVLDASDEALANDPELREALFQQQAELGRAAQAVAETKGGKIDVDYLAGLDYLADRTGSEYFLFVRGSGFFKTTGAQVKEAIVAGITAALFGGAAMGPGSATALEAYLVDAGRGKVVWSTSRCCNEKDPRKPSHLFDTCKQTLKPLIGSSDLKADKSHDDEIIDRYKELMKPAAEGEQAPPGEQAGQAEPKPAADRTSEEF